MDPATFHQEVIQTLEIELEGIKRLSPEHMTHTYLTDLRDIFNNLAENAQTVRDNLPQ